MQNIKLDLPVDGNILAHAAEFLNKCAADLGQKPEATMPADDTAEPAEPVPGTESGALPPSELFDLDNADPVLDQAPGIDPQENSEPQGDVDKAGYPWDAALHSSGKTFYQSGKEQGLWKRKRGISAEDVDAAQAALTPQLATTAVVDQGEGPQGNDEQIAAGAFAAPGAVPGATAPAAMVSVGTFPELMALIHTLRNMGKVDDDILNAQATAVAGVSNLGLMATQTPEMMQALGYALQAL